MLPSHRKMPQLTRENDSWNDAVRHYNLPVNGIEVVIPNDFKPRYEPAKQQPVHKIATLEPKVPVPTPTAPPPPPITPPEKPRRRLFRYLLTRSLMLTCGLAALGNIPVYSMVHSPQERELLNLTKNSDNSSPAQEIKDLNLPAVAVESFSGYAVDILPDAQQGSWSLRTVAAEDTLDSILKEFDLTKTAQKILAHSTIKQQLKNLLPGSRLLVQVVEGRLLQLIYAKSKTETFIVSATDQGFIGKWDSSVFETRESSAAFIVKHSIQRDGKQAGISNAVLRQLKDVFSKDTDFKKIRVGDQIGVTYEDFHYQGQSIYTDKVVAAEYATKGNRFQRVRFTLEDGNTDYFSPGDETALKRTAFDREPLAEGEGRISSGFGMRQHPVFGLFKNHAGVDFAAPYGTPIHATADGEVKFVGQQNGYGNVIELNHMQDISTLYGHMSGFVDTLKVGDKVKRGDVIGYVGSTGTSTGNHVHYEYRIAGEALNPLAVELPKVGIMNDTEASDFNRFASAKMQTLNEVRKLAFLNKSLKSDIGG